MSVANVALDSLDCFDTASTVLPYHRRVSIRYPCGLALVTKVRLEDSKAFRRVLGHNISQGGMALILDDVPEIGAVVQVRVKNRILNFSYDLAARVIHASPFEDGRWLMGVAFSRQLSLAELAGLL